jgi:hypothetical protein
MSTRILVVDSQQDNRQIIRDLLAPTVYEIAEAEKNSSIMCRVCGGRGPEAPCQTVRRLVFAPNSQSSDAEEAYPMGSLPPHQGIARRVHRDHRSTR